MYRCKECNAEYREKVEYCECGNNTFDYIEDVPPAKSTKYKQPLSLEQKSEIVSRIFFALCIILSILVWLIPVGNKKTVKKQPQNITKQQTKINKTQIPNIDKIWDDTPIYNPEPVESKPEQTRPLTPAEYVEQMKNSVTQQIFNQPKTATNTNFQDIQKIQKVQKVQKPQNISKPIPKQAPQKQEQVQKKNNIIIRQRNEMSVNPELLTPPKTQKPAYNPNSAEMLRYKNNLRAALFSKFAVGSIQGSGECSIQFSVDKTGKLINRKFSKESSNKGLNDTVYYMLMSVPRFTPPPSEYNGKTIRMNFKINNGNYEISIH